MPGIFLTRNQTTALRRVVVCFLDRTQLSPVIPEVFRVQCQVILSMIDEGDAFQQHEFDALVWLLDLYFEGFEYEDIDPYAEQAYAKLKGHWPFDVPPYRRMRDNPHLVGRYY